MRRTAVCLALGGALVTPAAAWNPAVLSGGSPLRWDTTSAVVWNPDGGPLGKLDSAQAAAMVGAEISKWSAATSALSFAQGGAIVDPGTGLPTDVTSANYAAAVGAADGQNPIIFDNQGEIFTLLGIPSGVVGFAGILKTSGAAITKSYAVFQGDWFDDEPAGSAPSDPGEVSETRFRGMMVHEFGHFVNLAHSSVNHELIVAGLPGCPAPTASQLETMGPFLHDDALTLHHDDLAGVSRLYPTGGFQTGFATLQGRLIDRDGATPFEGANVILRPDTSDCDALYEQAQGMLSGASPAESGGAGSFEFPGLAPGAAYTVFATTIQDGAAYPVTPAPSLGGPDDFYNGAAEDWFDPPDDPAVASAVTVGAGGTTVGGIDIKINNAGGPGEVPSDAAAGLQVELVGGASQGSIDLVLDDGDMDSATGIGGTGQAAWINRFTPTPGQLPFLIERIDVMFWHGSVAPGRAVRLLVYGDPAATGDPANAALLYSEDVTVQFLSTTAFNEYTLAAPVLVESGEFYVGVFDLVADADTTFIVSIDLDTASGRSYLQADGTSPSGFALQADRTWMVRARGSSSLPAGSVRLSWGDACNIGAAPGQDYAVYEGSLGSLRGAPDHAPITCSTGRATSYTVLSPGDDRFWLVVPILAGREGGPGSGTGGTPRTPAATCAPVLPDPCP